MIRIEKYTFGVFDRFGCQGPAQLRAILKAQENGIQLAPVWNKSNREHQIVGTCPVDVRTEADQAVKQCGWDGPYYVDADHIGLDTVEGFIDSSDFFTLDVADDIGKFAGEDAVKDFVDACGGLAGKITLPGLEESIEITENRCRTIAEKYLNATDRAAELYRYIKNEKGKGNFITEVSMDETDEPQTPEELLLILKALAERDIPLQTIAPKFSGSFFKGIDYIGDTEAFQKEFRADLAVINYATSEFDLPANLKLSIHSGSDKFSIYPIMKEALEEFEAGLHLKTAGTTWLEELIGLALSGGKGLDIAKEIYTSALNRIEEMCDPYASVIDIDTDQLPPAEDVRNWDGETYANALRHDPNSNSFNPHFRQLLHVAYKIAAEMDERYLETLRNNSEIVGKNVTENLYQRHIMPLFPAK